MQYLHSNQTMEELHIIGNLRTLDYHKAKHIAQLLIEYYPKQYVLSKCEELMELQWNIRRDKLKQETTNSEEKQISELIRDAVIFSNGCIKWTTSTFIQWIADNSLLPDFENSIADIDFPDIAHRAYVKYITNNKYDFVYMTISVEGKTLGQIVFELFQELCPNTTANFVSLCSGDHGFSEDETRLSYLNSIFHRIVPSGWIQGGDICGGSGLSGMSIYGRTFPDESYSVSHDSPGILGMVNEGRNTNSSQFYITLKPSTWMDKQYVAFGRVVEGTDVLEQMESLDCFNERPIQSCSISECGVLIVEDN